MCSDKTDMKKPLKEYYNGYQTIFISRDIKDISFLTFPVFPFYTSRHASWSHSLVAASSICGVRRSRTRAW